MKERRRYIRFLPKRGSFAAIGDGFSRIGKIIDISLGGFSFGYMRQIENDLEKYTEGAIFMSNNAIHIRNLPCIIVSDIPVDYFKVSIDSSISAESCRCGVKFNNLNSSQFKKIENFLQYFTKRRVQSESDLYLP